MVRCSIVSDFLHPMNCSLPGSSVHGFSKQEYWNGLPFPSPRRFPRPRVGTWVSCITGRFFAVWATRETCWLCWIFHFCLKLFQDGKGLRICSFIHLFLQQMLIIECSLHVTHSDGWHRVNQGCVLDPMWNRMYCVRGLPGWCWW